ncbi:MAG: hypothetical protein J6K19_03795 [Prevotella sp.]|nr:hypothetical protein [Prevotella sp.]
MERDSFIFYRSFYEAVKELPKDIRLEVYTAIMEYALYGKSPEGLKPFARGIFTLIKPSIDSNNTRFENGCKGGRKPRKATVTTAATPAAPATSRQETIATLDEEVTRLKAEQIWADFVCKQFDITAEEFTTRLDRFAGHIRCESEGRPHDSLTDAKRHFCSWMRIAYKAGSTTSKAAKDSQPTPTPDYSFRGGFGSKDI